MTNKGIFQSHCDLPTKSTYPDVAVDEIPSCLNLVEGWICNTFNMKGLVNPGEVCNIVYVHLRLIRLFFDQGVARELMGQLQSSPLEAPQISVIDLGSGNVIAYTALRVLLDHLGSKINKKPQLVYVAVDQDDLSTLTCSVQSSSSEEIKVFKNTDLTNCDARNTVKKQIKLNESEGFDLILVRAPRADTNQAFSQCLVQEVIPDFARPGGLLFVSHYDEKELAAFNKIINNKIIKKWPKLKETHWQRFPYKTPAAIQAKSDQNRSVETTHTGSSADDQYHVCSPDTYSLSIKLATDNASKNQLLEKSEPLKRVELFLKYLKSSKLKNDKRCQDFSDACVNVLKKEEPNLSAALRKVVASDWAEATEFLLANYKECLDPREKNSSNKSAVDYAKPKRVILNLLVENFPELEIGESAGYSP